MDAPRGKQGYTHYIISEPKEHNFDNVSRTKTYQNFYDHTYQNIIRNEWFKKGG
ncbi:hypothetical protein GCM10007063_04880 [Lentibacillus kapialis]|uniref:Uncharacterized protein n=1 Tax=Lentibacillus kapialis TaxID=340214 RepID=A0A917UTS9_9BACI|nr:hypothetical protein [Lentibacillus kapialis]GGJ85394.1 hypothetical protein GCM10007063_04880 [Lentibacillus kapialis]